MPSPVQVFAMQQVELAEFPKDGPVPLSEFLAIQDELRKYVGLSRGAGLYCQTIG